MKTRNSQWPGHRAVANTAYFCCVLSVVANLMIASALAQTSSSTQSQAYFADAIWNGAGETFQDAVLLVRDGKIVTVGPRDRVLVPDGAERIELGPVTLIPGLVIAQTNLVRSDRSDTYAISPEIRASDGFDPFGEYDGLLASGITTIQISPPNNRLMPGQGAVVKLAGGDGGAHVLSEAESLRIILSRSALSPPTVFEPPVGAVSVDRPIEPTQPQLATSLAQAVVGLQALLDAASDVNPEGASDDPSLSALAKIRTDGLAVRWTANTQAEIAAALALSQQFELPWMIVDPDQVDALAEESIWKSKLARGVVLHPNLSPGRITNPNVPRSGQIETPPVWERARSLIDVGAADRIAFRPSTDSDLEKVLYLASVLARGGIDADQILRMVTSNPAKMLGVGDRVGTLQPKADADFVVLSGKPLRGSTKVVATFVDGKRVYEAHTTNQSVVIRASSIHTPSGLVKGGSVSVADGKISGVGRNVTATPGAQIRDFGEAVIVPGFVDCATSLGIGGPLTSQVSLGTELGEFLARDDDQIALARQGGVTTALLSSTRLPSPVLAFKLSDSPRALKDPVALRYEIRGNLTSSEASIRRLLKAGKAYADSWDKYDAEYAEYQKKLKVYEAEKKKYDAAVKAQAAKKAAEKAKAETEAKKKASQDSAGKSDKEDEQEEKQSSEKEAEKSDVKSDADKDKQEADKKESAEKKESSKESSSDAKLEEPKKPTEPKKPRSSSSLEPYRDLFGKKIAAMVQLSHPKAAAVAVKLFRKEYDLKTAVVAGKAAAENAKLLSENDVLVVVGPRLVEEEDGKLRNYPAELVVAGADIAFQSMASTGVKELPQAVSYSVYEGLGRDDALEGLSTNPATFFGLESIGAISLGADADLVVLSGPPAELSTDVLAVMIDGKWVYEKESE